MVSPTPGDIARARETSPSAFDDTLGLFRQQFVRTVQASIVYHKDNAADPTLTFYQIGVADPANLQPKDSAGHTYGPRDTDGYFRKKSGTALTLADVFGPAATNLPNDGQVPYAAGARIDGQISYYDVDGGQGIVPGNEALSDVKSVADAIMKHTELLTCVRIATINERMATTDKDWTSKTFPATFNDPPPDHVVPAKGDTLIEFMDLYGFKTQGTKTGMTSMASPFQSAPPYAIFADTVQEDAVRGPVIDSAGNGGGPDPYGMIISAASLQGVFQRMQDIWNESKSSAATVMLDYCHSSCHASCHSSRSRR